MNSLCGSVAAAVLGCALSAHGQATAPSGALSPATPAKPAPTSPVRPGANTGTPPGAQASPSDGTQTQLPALPSPTAGQTTSPSGGNQPQAGQAAPEAPSAGKGASGAQGGGTLPLALPSGGNLTQPPSVPLLAQPTVAPVQGGATAGAGQAPVTGGTTFAGAAASGAAVSGSPNAEQAGTATAPGAPITLEEAIRRARSIDHTYVAAVVEKGTADAERTIARSDLLPQVDFHNQVIYTKPQRPYETSATGTTTPSLTGSPAPVFIANNAVREYISQGVVTETVGLARWAALQKAYADQAVAVARLEIARRGLVATVVGAYYGLLAAQAKQANAARALAEANRFLTVSRQLESGGEAAHADVLKAQIEESSREREFEDAQLAALKAKLDLGVLLFPDPRVDYALAADLDHPPALGTRADLQASAKTGNPDVRAALAAVRSAEVGVVASRAAYLPDLSLAYNYGIDAPQFALTDAYGQRNLGYAATATLDIPVWDWFATHARVKQSELQRQLAKADLTAAQRRALAAFEEFYAEADVASRQMASLDRSVADAREALRLTGLKYAAGEGTALEVVDAENTLVAAENARADGAVRYYEALASLQTMTGNLP